MFSDEIRAASLNLQTPVTAGDLVLGEKNEYRYELRFGATGATFNAYRVSAEERAAAFVAPPAYDTFRDAVRDQAIVVLTGPAGYGKGAALLQLLTRGPSGTDAVFRLDPATDLSTLTCDEVPPCSVLLLDDLPESSLDGLQDWVVQRLEAQLRDHECRLGMTTTAPGSRLTASGGCLLLELAERPDLREVYEQTLAQQLMGRPGVRDALRAQPDLQETVQEYLDPSQPLRAVTRLARLVAALADDPVGAGRRLRDQVSGYADEECARWFRGLGDLKANCFAVSLAVLDGLARETVAQEAERLEELLLPDPDTVIAPQQPPNPFAVAASVSPARLRAEVVTQARSTTLGEVRAQVMRYGEPRFAGRVLRHVWREHDWIRSPLSTWLYRLGRAPELRVRVRAAAAVGVLARESVEFLTDHVIGRWARDEDVRVRDSAAVALAAVVDEPALTPTVRSLINEWSEATEPTTGVLLRATAARAYGAALGLHTPTAALRALARLADDDDLDVLVAVSNSYCELVLEATAPLCGRVLHEMDRMAHDRKPEYRLAAGLAVLTLLQGRGAPQSWGDRPSRRGWPTVLVLAAERPAITPLLTGLIVRGVVDRDLAPLIGEVLDGWARAADQDRELREAVVDLLARSPRDDRARTTIVRRAQRWAGRDGHAPVTGQSLLRRLA